MSSTPDRNNPRTARTSKLSSTGPNLRKIVLLNITSLSTNKSNDHIKQKMINQVQDMYKLRDTTNFEQLTQH